MSTNKGLQSSCFSLLLLVGCVKTWGDARENADALADLRSKGTVEIAVYAQFPPFSSGNGGADSKGIDVDLARAIAQRLGLKLKLRMVSAGESVSDDLRNHIGRGHYLGGGVADVMLHVGYDPQFAGREKNAVLFAPYFHESVVVAYKPNRIKNLESPIALTEHKIGVEGDTISDHIMSSAYGGALRTSAVRKLSLADAVKALKADQVDGVMGPQGELQGLLAEQHISGVLFHPQEQIGQMRTTWDVGVAVKESGSNSLSDAVAKILTELKTDGSLKKIFISYGVNYVDAAPAAADKTVTSAARAE